MARAGSFVRLLGSAVMAQALLSAANLLVGLILIRWTSDQQYGSYVLVLNALMLITQVQNQFITPGMVLRMAANPAGRADLIGGLYREQRRLLPLLGAVLAAGAGALWLCGALPLGAIWLVLATIVAALMALHREFFRMVLNAYRRPLDVLRADTAYVALLLAGVVFATHTAAPALVTVLSLAVASATGGILLSRALWRHEPWATPGQKGSLRELARIGAWTTGSSAIHWTFTQGYNYLIASTLNVSAVAAVAATRLLMMPINMLSTGVSSLMMPTTSAWIHQHGSHGVFRRLLRLSLAMAGLALCYFAVIWLLRDWVFAHVLHKQFAHRDELILFWLIVFILMLLRDQLMFLPLVRGHFRAMTGVTLLSAVLSLSASYFAMLRIGVLGALIGIMVGEIVSILGVLWVSAFELRDARSPRPRAGSAAAAAPPAASEL